MRKEKLMADNVVRQVVDLLTAASSNPLDGGVSDALCQAIYTAWQAKSNGKNKGKMLEAMEREIRSNAQKMSLMESGVTTSSGSPSNQKGGKRALLPIIRPRTTHATSTWKSAWWKWRPAS